MSITADDEPTPLDVLLGKGRKIQNHAGNVRLREIGSTYRDSYKNKPNPTKTRIRQEIVDAIRASGGRFLEMKGGVYEDVGDKRAREKVRHVLSDTSRASSSGSTSQSASAIKKKKNKTKKKNTAAPKKETATLESTTPPPPPPQQLYSRSSSSSSSLLLGDVEEQKKIRERQQRLLLLRHAATCKHQSCPVTPHCAKMKRLWRHLEFCDVEECDFKHCVSSKYVLSHYRECEDHECPECGPVRATLVKSGGEQQQQGRRRSSRRLSTTVVAV